MPLGAGTVVYTHDEADRLTGADYGGGNRLSYTYDSGSNLTNTTGKTPLESTLRADSFSYDDASRISSPGYTSDSRGRLTAAPGRALTYDGAGRLTSITAGGSTATLTYNGVGDLRTRAVGGVTTTYFHNYALGLSPLAAEKEGTSYKRFYVYTPSGRLLYSVDAVSKAVRFYHFDRIGSTLFLTDGSGAVSDGYAYDPYGNLLSQTGTSDQPFTYVGAYGVRREPAGNLYRMRARCYDPGTARFLSRDPVWPVPADPQSLNPYQYAALNPSRYIDHLGTEPWDPTVSHVQTGLNSYVPREEARAREIEAINALLRAGDPAGVKQAVEFILRAEGYWSPQDWGPFAEGYEQYRALDIQGINERLMAGDPAGLLQAVDFIVKETGYCNFKNWGPFAAGYQQYHLLEIEGLNERIMAGDPSAVERAVDLIVRERGYFDFQNWGPFAEAMKQWEQNHPRESTDKFGEDALPE